MTSNYFIKIAVIRKLPNGKYRVKSRSGKNLGTYDSLRKAKKRLRQIEMFKHMKKASVQDQEKIDLTAVNEFQLSTVMRSLRQQLPQKHINIFLKVYKAYFDAAVKKDLQKPETLALAKALIKLNKIKQIKINKEIIKEAAVSELGNPEQVGQYLAGIIKFIMQRISAEKRPNSLNNLKNKLYILNETEISNKKMPASSAIGQSITLVKHILFSHDAKYIREVINNIVRNL